MNLEELDIKHIAIIMDGNGRWATEQGLDRTAGHAAGEHSLSKAIDWALENILKYLKNFTLQYILLLRISLNH